MAKRQEQETANPEVTEVAPNVLRMQLPIRMPGLGHVNMYALLDDHGAAVVDPGLPGPFNWKAIENRLRQAELKPKDIHTVIVTHSHPDHFGGAARFVKEHGAKVIAHRSFRFGIAESVSNNTPEVSLEDLEAQRDLDDGEEAEARDENDTGATPGSPHDHDHGHNTNSGTNTPQMGWWGGPSPWGGQSARPPLRRRLQWGIMRALGGAMSVPEVSHPVEQGDVLYLAGREMFVLHTPGHTPDHFCLHDPEAGIFLAGDHVLPSITPHISGISTSEDPLLSFFYSLDRVGEISGINKALPAHGHPFDDLTKRTEEIKRHHFERLDRIREISREFGRPASVEEFSKHLFKQRSWGSMAESETYAHLEHLRHAREAESHRDKKGVLLYLTS
ncbi:MAG: MBL fold metallo-hydrolase [Gammaproteobacteria bacterium]|nr:MBL fold metallo-hydrolase [Gammaproteobacteria bacterium]